MRKKQKNDKKGVELEIGLKGNEELINLELNKIVPNPNQPRKKFNEDTIRELAGSISASQQLVPIIVSPLKNGRYLIVDGERRYRAAKDHLKLNSIPAMVMPMTEEQIAINSLSVNIHRDDLEPEEREGYVYTLHTKYKLSERQIAAKVGWSPTTIHNLLTTYNDRRKLLTQVSIKIPEKTSTTVFVATEKLKNDPQARAEFIQMVDEQRDGLRVNKDHLTRYCKIYADAPRDIQEKIYLGELTFQEAEKIINTIKKTEQKIGEPIAEEDKEQLVDFFEQAKHERERLDKFNEGVAQEIAMGNLKPQISQKTKDLQKSYKMTDKFHDLRGSLREVVIAHDIHFKAEYDDPDAMAKIQRMVMEVLNHVGAEQNMSEEKRIAQLQELADYYDIVHKLTGLMRPLVENEIKNSKTVDLEKLR